MIDCHQSQAFGSQCHPGSITSIGTICHLNGTVVCQDGLVFENGQCQTPRNWIKQPGLACNAVSSPCDYTLGLHCHAQSSTCVCASGLRWSQKTGTNNNNNNSNNKCEIDMTVECSTHRDCSFAYGPKSVCVYNGRCLCGIGSTVVHYAQLTMANVSQFFITNYCSPNEQITKLGILGDECFLPGFPKPPSKSCSTDLVCHHCPEFGPKPTLGRCLDLFNSSSSYAQKRQSIYKVATIDQFD